MSPDPPREASQEDNDLTEEAVYFMAIADDDDDFMGDENEAHELDYSSHEDSDFSDAEDATGATTTRTSTRNIEHGSTASNHGESNGRMMAHYQLLIPFPQPENTSSSEAEFDHENEIPQNPQVAVLSPAPTVSDSSSINNTATVTVAATGFDTGVETEPNDNEDKSKKLGEINLTEDKVEIIKNAMKGFTLPPSSIPNWAEEIDETSWKERLSSSIQRKPSTTTTPTNSQSNKVVH